MNESETNAAARVYRILPYFRFLVVVMSIALAAGAVGGVWFIGDSIPGAAAWILSLGCLALLSAGGYAFLRAINSRIVLSGDTITVRGAFIARSLERSQIRGRRVRRNGHTRETVLVPIYEGARKIAVSPSFRTDPFLSEWLASLHDLDLEAWARGRWCWLRRSAPTPGARWCCWIRSSIGSVLSSSTRPWSAST